VNFHPQGLCPPIIPQSAWALAGCRRSLWFRQEPISFPLPHHLDAGPAKEQYLSGGIHRTCKKLVGGSLQTAGYGLQRMWMTQSSKSLAPKYRQAKRWNDQKLPPSQLAFLEAISLLRTFRASF
jgi:hypothetical protein